MKYKTTVFLNPAATLAHEIWAMCSHLARVIRFEEDTYFLPIHNFSLVHFFILSLPTLHFPIRKLLQHVANNGDGYR